MVRSLLHWDTMTVLLTGNLGMVGDLGGSKRNKESPFVAFSWCLILFDC